MNAVNPPRNTPWQTLGLDPNETNLDVIRHQYLDQIKLFPPEKDPIRFEQIRDAYLELRKRCHLAGGFQLDVDPQAAVVSLLPPRKVTRAFTGPQLWQAVLQG